MRGIGTYDWVLKQHEEADREPSAVKADVLARRQKERDDWKNRNNSASNKVTDLTGANGSVEMI
jgi:hypothetical protein